jgi:hypothetical protein
MGRTGYRGQRLARRAAARDPFLLDFSALAEISRKALLHQWVGHDTSR